MRIFVISQGQDVGGQGYRTAMAFRKYTDWDVQSMCAAETYIRFPYQHLFDWETAKRLYDRADLVEHQNWLYGYAMYERNTPGKPTVVRHHGTPLRSNPSVSTKEAASIRATELVSTVDLLRDSPSARWMPNFYDLEALRATYPRRKSNVLRIGHGPTVREVKGTELILKTLSELSRMYSFEVELTEKVTWAQSLKRKAWCDIWIDQIGLGYGGSAIEAMNLGIPVVAGWEDPEDLALFESIVGSVPFVHVTKDSLRDKLIDLIESGALREEWGQKGQDYVQCYHSDYNGVEALKKIYEGVKPSRGIQYLWLRPEFKKADIMKKWHR